MRLTILINGSDPTVNHDYAVLWLDTDEHVWSRESHDGIDLPPWGELRDEGGVTNLCAPTAEQPLCTLRGLHVERDCPTAAQGGAQWSSGRMGHAHGVWRLQAVEKMAVRPENSVFRR
ncbi:DUF3564 family protein [Trinickia dinghuensis]|uniref:DUF3564 family protein n=1 Tax=Trinickia dinghuensis TaxID=2291023 RepID=A0A3D8JPR1_9BURK|nr:DUF3564 family protein [Trinickia dinghuensis]RDU94695.1 DUF3564 family protein [Trinickia dinghuensis]